MTILENATKIILSTDFCKIKAIPIAFKINCYMFDLKLGFMQIISSISSILI